MPNIKTYLAAGVLYKANKLVRYFEETNQSKKDLSCAYRIRNNAAAEFLIEEGGVKEYKDDKIYLSINEENIELSVDPIRKILGDRFDLLLSNNLPRTSDLTPTPPTNNLATHINSHSPSVQSEDNNSHIAEPMPIDMIEVASLNLYKIETKETEEDILKEDKPEVSKVDKSEDITKDLSDDEMDLIDEDFEEKEQNSHVPKLSITKQGINNYKIINKGVRVSDEKREANAFLSDQYKITVPEHKTITLTLVPISLPEDGAMRCDILCYGDDSETIKLAVSDENHICHIEIDGVNLYANAYVIDGVYSSAVTAPGQKDVVIDKKEIRPEIKKSGIGHLTVYPNGTDCVHAYPIVVSVDRDVMCPVFGVIVRGMGYTNKMTPFISADGTAKLELETMNIILRTYWKDKQLCVDWHGEM